MIITITKMIITKRKHRRIVRRQQENMVITMLAVAQQYLESQAGDAGHVHLNEHEVVTFAESVLNYVDELEEDD
jgi:hypothetical protein